MVLGREEGAGMDGGVLMTNLEGFETAVALVRRCSTGDVIKLETIGDEGFAFRLSAFSTEFFFDLWLP